MFRKHNLHKKSVNQVHSSLLISFSTEVPCLPWCVPASMKAPVIRSRCHRLGPLRQALLCVGVGVGACQRVLSHVAVMCDILHVTEFIHSFHAVIDQFVLVIPTSLFMSSLKINIENDLCRKIKNMY